MNTSTDSSPPRLATLDVLGVGLSVEMFQQSQVWLEMQKSPAESILSADILDYPKTFAEREKAREARSANVLKWAISNFVDEWPIPSVSVWPHLHKQNAPTGKADERAALFANRIDELRTTADLKSHRIAGLGAFFQDQSEAVMEDVFRFFELNPEVPVLLLFITDGDVTRMESGDLSREEYWEDGPRRFGSLAESTVAFLLARRERVDALRPFASAAATAGHAQGKTSTGFRPSKLLPVPWSLDQIQRFDRLPTISVLHRPTCVSYRKDKSEQPAADAVQRAGLMYPKQRRAEFSAGFNATLNKLPGGKPARIFYDTGGPDNGINLVPLATAAEACLEEFDLFRPDEGYDIHARLGDTGAASPFVQWALATMASFYNKDASMTVNLRRNDEATITVVTPAPVIATAPKKRMHSPSPASPNQIAKPRNVALGTRMASGEECPQSGMWQCDRADADAGTTHFIPVGRTFPPVNVPRQLTAWQKVRGDSALEKVATAWTLVSYE